MNKSDFDNLVKSKLATCSYDEAKDLYTYKYHRKVFYKNLWNLDPLLLDCRGIVFNGEGELVQRPFRKTFNIGENGTDLKDDELYMAYHKYNGFMAAVTWYKDKPLISTTGSTKSYHAELAEKHLLGTELEEEWKASPDYTWLYEIVDESDPHIVEEEIGAHPLARIRKEDGLLIPDANSFAFVDTGEEAKKLLRECFGEGYMFYTYGGQSQMVAKGKSPYYLSKKAMMRMSKTKANWMWDNPKSFKEEMIDEEFYDCHKWLITTYTKEDWLTISEQERRQIIEEYFYG